MTDFQMPFKTPSVLAMPAPSAAARMQQRVMESGMQRCTAAFVDLDGTCISNRCKFLLPFYVVASMPSWFLGVWKAAQLTFCLIMCYVLKVYTEEDFFRVFLRGVSADVLGAAGERAARMMSNHVHGPVVSQLCALKRAGAQIIVLTSNVRPLVEPFVTRCLHFELPSGAATELNMTEDGCVSRIAPLTCGWNTGSSKASLVRQLVASRHIKYSMAFGYQVSDVPMLEAANDSAVVNPNKVLHQMALRQGWQVLRCKSEPIALDLVQQSAVRVAIIGGGWAGLYSLKYCLQQGLDAILFEKSDEIGGQWVFRPEESGGVFQHTIATASRGFMQASDFPFNDELPEFLSHKEYREYLHKYASTFNLADGERIRLSTSVAAQRVDGSGANKCHVLTVVGPSGSQEELSFDRMIFCTGSAHMPRVPAEFDKFDGKVLHSADYKNVDESMQGKRILLVGGGESASHIAQEVSLVSSKCVWSIRNGCWFMDRHSGVRAPADMRFNRLSRMIMGNQLDRFGGLFNKVVGALTTFAWGKGGIGVPEWQPIDDNIMRSWVNKDRDFTWQLSTGRLQPKGGIASVEGSTVKFEDGTAQQFDIIIASTGFTQQYPTRKGAGSTGDSPSWCKEAFYKHVFSCSDPTVARVGIIRPTFGSVPSMAETQARWVAATFAGTACLPSSSSMCEAMKSDAKRRAVQFPHYHDKLHTLENYWSYTEQLQRYFGWGHLGCRPTLFRIMKLRGFKAAKLWINAPPNNFESLLLNADEALSAWAWDQLQQQYQRYQADRNHRTDFGPSGPLKSHACVKSKKCQ